MVALALSMCTTDQGLSHCFKVHFFIQIKPLQQWGSPAYSCKEAVGPFTWIVRPEPQTHTSCAWVRALSLPSMGLLITSHEYSFSFLWIWSVRSANIHSSYLSNKEVFGIECSWRVVGRTCSLPPQPMVQARTHILVGTWGCRQSAEGELILLISTNEQKVSGFANSLM